jgi:peptide/nickel transport system substrate-binding protein
MSSRLLRLALVALGLALPWSPMAASTDAPRLTATVNFGPSDPIPDPRSRQHGWYTNHAGISETLVGLGYDMQLVPRLATSWKNIDPLTWELTLREGVRFHDGSFMDAEAVKASFEVMWQEGHPGHNPRYTKLLDVASIEAKGMTVTFRTNKPNAAFLWALTEPYAAVLRPTGTVELPLIATGPYIFVANEPSRRLSVRAFPDYWGGTPKLSAIDLDAIPDAQTARLALEAGDVQLALNYPETDFARLQRDGAGDLQLFSAPTLRLFFMSANLRSGPMSDPVVREALSLAIDRKAVVDIATGGAGGVPARTVFPLTMQSWVNTAVTLSDDAAQAVQKLDAAGVIDSDGNGIREWKGKDIKLVLGIYEGRAAFKPASETIQAMMAAVGIGVEVRLGEYEANNAALRAGEMDLHLQAWNTAPQGDPSYFPETLLQSTAELNDGGYKSARLDELLVAGRTTFDPAARRKIYDEVQALILADLPLIPLFHGQQTSVGNGRVEGFRIHPAENFMVGPALTLRP